MKRNKNKRVSSSAIIKYLIAVVLSSAAVWLGSNIALTQFSVDIDESQALIINLLVVGIITFLYFVASVRALDREYDALDGIVEDDYVSPRLPVSISKKHKAVEESIKKELKYKDFEVQEAEQRKNDLVVYLAHDLKTPLTSIIGYLSLLQESPDLSVEYRAKYTDIALDKAYRLEQLINEFFDITRFNLQSFTLEKNHIDLVMMLRQMAEEFYPVLGTKGLTCTVNANEKINIVGDADKLSRVFDNLMRNASNYCYENTEIVINAFTQNGRAVVTFINKGDEIPDEKLQMIFEKFFRADDARRSSTGGSGLGLAIAKQIVERHGGTITASSSPKATVFKVELPFEVQS